MFKTPGVNQSSTLHIIKQRFQFDKSRGVQYISQKTYDSVVEMLDTISKYKQAEPEKTGWDYWFGLVKKKQNNFSSYMRNRYSESLSGALKFSAPTATLIESNRDVDFVESELVENYTNCVLPDSLQVASTDVIQRVFDELKDKVQGCSISEQSLIVNNYGFSSIFGN